MLEAVIMVITTVLFVFYLETLLERIQKEEQKTRELLHKVLEELKKYPLEVVIDVLEKIRKEVDYDV